MLTTMQILLLAVLFLCLSYGAWLLLGMLAPDRWRSRLRAIQSGGQALREDRLEQLKKLAQGVGRLAGETDDGALQRKLVQAGYRTQSAVGTFMGLRVLLCAILLLAAWLAVPDGWRASSRSLAVLLAAAAGFYLPGVVLSRQVRQRQQDLARSLPDALDLMSIAVDAGLGLDAAVMRVTEKIGIQSAALRTELDTTWMEIQAGVARADALRNLAKRTGVEDINLLVALLNSADQLGVPVSGALHNFSATLRVKRQQSAEEQAAKMPVKLLFPLVLLVLPVLLVEIIGPSGVQIARALSAMHEGP